MVQILQLSFKAFIKNKTKLNYIVSYIVIVLFSYIFLNTEIKGNSLLKESIQNLFTFSSIFSAILITFIISKIFQIRNEKRDLRIKIVILSNKVTDLRRICEKLISNYDVWDSKTKSKLENKYKTLSYQHLYDDYQNSKPKQLISEYLEDGDLRGATFYLALRDLVRRKGRKFNLELYGDYDEDIIYPFETIRIWHGISCANAFFYYLDHRYNSYKENILIDKLTSEEKREIENLAKKINKEKYIDRSFDRHLLVDIGNDFEVDYFPKLYDLLYEFQNSFSNTFIYTLRLLYIIIFFGVFIPMIFPFLNNSITIQIGLVYISTLTILIIFINFMIDFIKILKNEINLE